MSERIDFISEYCDRWCERCAFTDRCSAYAVKVAIAMCDGDLEKGIELAVGQAQPEDNSPKEVPIGQQLMDDALANITQQELDDAQREEELRHARVDEMPLKTASMEYTVLAHTWLQDKDRAMPADSALREALDVIGWDSALIGAKLYRAMMGADRRDEWEEEDPLQNDWNGSAKLALLLLRRTSDAWRVVIQHSSDPEAKQLLEAAEIMAGLVEAQFPNAMRFQRPGFDE
jgi:hypothetical protein